MCCGVNTLAYANGLPVGLIDPLGLDPNQMCAAACTLAGITAGGILGGPGATWPQ